MPSYLLSIAGVIRPIQAFRGISMERAARLAAIEGSRHWLIPVPECLVLFDTCGLAGFARKKLRG